MKRFVKILILFSAMLIVFGGCNSLRKTLNSWLGHTKHHLIERWGPPLRTRDNGAKGEILVYPRVVKEPGSVGFSWSDDNGNRYYVPATQGYSYWRYYYFYINENKKVYRWMYRNNMPAPSSVDVYHHDGDNR